MPSFRLILQFRGRAVEDVDQIAEIEDALFEMLTAGEELDGHEIGASARNIYIATSDPEATFRRLTPFLAGAQLLDEVIAAARGPDVHGYAVLWPSDHTRAFSPT
jgi:hypothetical protein